MKRLKKEFVKSIHSDASPRLKKELEIEYPHVFSNLENRIKATLLLLIRSGLAEIEEIDKAVHKIMNHFDSEEYTKANELLEIFDSLIIEILES